MKLNSLADLGSLSVFLEPERYPPIGEICGFIGNCIVYQSQIYKEVKASPKQLAIGAPLLLSIDGEYTLTSVSGYRWTSSASWGSHSVSGQQIIEVESGHSIYTLQTFRKAVFKSYTTLDTKEIPDLDHQLLKWLVMNIPSSFQHTVEAYRDQLYCKSMPDMLFFLHTLCPYQYPDGANGSTREYIDNLFRDYFKKNFYIE